MSIISQISFILNELYYTEFSATELKSIITEIRKLVNQTEDNINNRIQETYYSNFNSKDILTNLSESFPSFSWECTKLYSSPSICSNLPLFEIKGCLDILSIEIIYEINVIKNKEFLDNIIPCWNLNIYLSDSLITLSRNKKYNTLKEVIVACKNTLVPLYKLFNKLEIKL